MSVEELAAQKVFNQLFQSSIASFVFFQEAQKKKQEVDERAKQLEKQKEFDEQKRIENEEKERLKREEQERIDQEKLKEYQQLEEDLEKQMEEARKIAVQARIQEELKRLKEQVCIAK